MSWYVPLIFSWGCMTWLYTPLSHIRYSFHRNLLIHALCMLVLPYRKLLYYLFFG